MKNKNFKTKNGFTLIETMVSVFILTIALSAFMTIVASSLSAARYANSEITANYLAQEAIDGIRNDRDAFFQRQSNGEGVAWYNFTTKYGAPSNKCFNANGCSFDVTALLADTSGANITLCSTTCSSLNYDTSTTANKFYTYDPVGGTIVKSNFTRKVTMAKTGTNGDSLDITVTVDWKNGSLTRTRTLKASLTNWQQ